jgi:hypothetical protein
MRSGEREGQANPKTSMTKIQSLFVDQNEVGRRCDVTTRLMRNGEDFSENFALFLTKSVENTCRSSRAMCHVHAAHEDSS